jgi:hypothetical protein
MALASAVILGSEPRGIHDHILLSQIRDSPNLEGQVPVFLSSRSRVAWLYNQALGSLSVTSNDSQGYGGGIGPRLYTGLHSWPRTSIGSRWHGPNTKHRFQRFLHFRVTCSLVGNVFIDPLPRTGSGVILCFRSLCLATAASFNYHVAVYFHWLSMVFRVRVYYLTQKIQRRWAKQSWKIFSRSPGKKTYGNMNKLHRPPPPKKDRFNQSICIVTDITLSKVLHGKGRCH